jgi:hypothetical protein
MRAQTIVSLAFLSALLFLAPRDAQAMGGTEGTFEYAIDAPWRIEPVIDREGKVSYGAIPIQIMITDENVIPLDSARFDGTGNLVFTDRKIGNFCELAITHHTNVTRHVRFNELTEIEMTGNATTTWQTGSWIKGQPAPPHAICTPTTQSCDAFRSPHGTSEWSAIVWYAPDVRANFVPGADLMLTLTAKFSRAPEISCTSTNAQDFLELKNYVSIHAGEAPLPRFGDNRWAYGDLHYHGQGTDNEGESGYSYRGIIRAMGAMGLDFVLATEHASDSAQFLDIDYNGPFGGIFNSGLIKRCCEVLRDMNADRFIFLQGQLWGSNGVNQTAALDGRDSNGAMALPQTVLGHGAAPQIFLGGEVDAMPEVPLAIPYNGGFNFGGAPMQHEARPRYWMSYLCGGWEFDGVKPCPQEQVVQADFGVNILKDVQGLDAIHPARVHMVYMPRDPMDLTGFVSSRTGVFGGASRHLTLGNDGVFPEMESNSPSTCQDPNPSACQKGYTFLAHPIPTGSCDGREPDMNGDEGPNVIPYSDLMYDQAFASKAVLGLEFWNEDTRMQNAANTGTAHERGFEGAGKFIETRFKSIKIRNVEPKGFETGKFEMYPWVRFPEPSYDKACTSMEWTLFWGTRQWDAMLLRGINPDQTRSLSWLSQGEPRRLYTAGGSDAHGDLNYHRAGYVTGLTQTDDMAIGKPRNLVMAGVPDTVISREGQPGPNTVGAHSHGQILNALINGAFSVTDGPALRIAIDRNGNGVIDDNDIPMGSVVEMYGEKTLPLLVQWDSTPEWGWVEQIDIVIGALSTASTAHPTLSDLYAPQANGARTVGTPAGDVVGVRITVDGREIHTRNDGYTDDPTGGRLRFNPVSFSGTRKIEIPLALLDLGRKQGRQEFVAIPDRLFIRAFARSQQREGTRCVPDPKSGACLWRYAYANPIWAISPPHEAGVCPRGRPRAIDSDGDGLPDGCDPCPHGGVFPRCQFPTNGDPPNQ